MPPTLGAPNTTATRTSRAAVFYGVGLGLRIEDVQVTGPGPREVLIEVAACGACHSDVHKLQGHGTVAAPNIFGHELAGTVRAVGTGVDHVRPGDRVACTFLVPCGECAACRSGAEDNCGPFRTMMQAKGLRYDGTHRYHQLDGTPLRASGVGGLVGLVSLPAGAVFPLPDGWPEAIPLTDVAVLGCAGLTAYGAVNRAAKVRPGANVVVLAAGGVGLCTVALARHAGAGTITVSDIRDESLAAARGFGATGTVHAGDRDFDARVGELAGGAPIDVVFDTIGTPGTVAQALRIVGIGGTVVVSGLAGTGGPGRIEDLNGFVRNKITLVGSYAAVPGEDMPKLLEAVRDGALDPARLISARFPFDRAEDAYGAVAAGTVTGRALIEY
ncbi:zinc-binding dehydrogenase [Actinomadura rubrisoli]|uniref:zinc-binding dehydrogenase n=1 Tax=Actinomadura rubrisoli TaxID=2530368 RepID=UPI00140500E4|nr:alcohol dehydrogenase catalytic domain-containing protein [Actinomadura rubrisoli]